MFIYTYPKFAQQHSQKNTGRPWFGKDSFGIAEYANPGSIIAGTQTFGCMVPMCGRLHAEYLQPLAFLRTQNSIKDRHHPDHTKWGKNAWMGYHIRVPEPGKQKENKCRMVHVDPEVSHVLED